MTDHSDQRHQRRAKLAALRALGNPYPNDFRRDALAGDLHTTYADKEAVLAAAPVRVKVAGRMMSQRIMGKAAFAHLQDMTGRLQLFLQRQALPSGVYDDQFKKWDIGDIIAAEGILFHTRTGELSVRVESIRLLSKALRPLPEKHHGLTDPELRYRQRYVDLIMNPVSRAVFTTRAAIIHHIRDFMHAERYLEVETPMMHPIAGGALARPFITHHNALDMPLYLRIAPELYLKRLVVGGFERVFEINRNFRNEGVSARHNPEFTMLEFYCAYTDYHDLMDFTERMLRGLCIAITGTPQLTYQGNTIDFALPFTRTTMLDAIISHNPDIAPSHLTDHPTTTRIAQTLDIDTSSDLPLGKLHLALFEKTVEPKLVAPTFITAYPVSVSPLSRRSDSDPELSDRFELFIAGLEIANGFSELNDPEDQAARFRHQLTAAERGDHEAMHFDADYIRALEHALPPTAGEGIGIDRLIMLLTNTPSIRDALLFPHMRPEATL